VALIGFGLDSVIEVSSAAVARQLAGSDPNRREQVTLRNRGNSVPSPSCDTHEAAPAADDGLCIALIDLANGERGS
jgi:hypothetical protein